MFYMGQGMRDDKEFLDIVMDPCVSLSVVCVRIKL